MSTLEPRARNHLGPETLRVIDGSLSYGEMAEGQTLTIFAQDARTKQTSSFSLTVLSIRVEDINKRLKIATFAYENGDFGFYDGDDTSQIVTLEAGAFMENGVSTTLYPQPQMGLVNFGGIGTLRDHSFEYINGTNRSVIVHRVEAIEVVAPPANYQPPNLEEHFRRIEETRRQQADTKDEAERGVLEFTTEILDSRFKDHPARPMIERLLTDFSIIGRPYIAQFLAYAELDGVFEKAWEVLQETFRDEYEWDPPIVRGDPNFRTSNRTLIFQMMARSGVQWPRSDRR